MDEAYLTEKRTRLSDMQAEAEALAKVEANAASSGVHQDLINQQEALGEITGRLIGVGFEQTKIKPVFTSLWMTDPEFKKLTPSAMCQIVMNRLSGRTGNSRKDRTAKPQDTATPDFLAALSGSYTEKD